MTFVEKLLIILKEGLAEYKSKKNIQPVYKTKTISLEEFDILNEKYELVLKKEQNLKLENSNLQTQLKQFKKIWFLPIYYKH